MLYTEHSFLNRSSDIFKSNADKRKVETLDVTCIGVNVKGHTYPNKLNTISVGSTRRKRFAQTIALNLFLISESDSAPKERDAPTCAAP